MLIEFSVKNYRSFSDKQTLSMVAGTSSRKNSIFSFKSPNSHVENLLKSACIFGANGAGKSSFIMALGFFRDFIIKSARDTQEGEQIDVSPHQFKDGFNSQPSEFEIIFIHGESLYQYGFALDEHRVHEEWLFSKPNTEKSRMRLLFQREYDANDKIYNWDISKTFLKGEKEVWKQSTRSNALFLSQAVQLNSADLKEPFEWVQKNLRIISSANKRPTLFSWKKLQNQNWKARLLDFFQTANINIHDITVDDNDESSGQIEELPNGGWRFTLPVLKYNSVKKSILTSYHKNDKGELIPLDFEQESDGTNILLNLAAIWFDVLENGFTLIIDELNNSLHPLVVKLLVNLFHDPKINTKNAQLIFTSHETSVMARGFMHKDQIWLAEKNQSESTELIPLSDFKVRDISNFQKAYLSGRFGGIPRIKDFRDAK